MNAGDRSKRFKLGDKFTHFFLLFCLMLGMDALGPSARAAGMKAFGVPFSPGFAVFCTAFTLFALFNVWLSFMSLKVGEGWVEAPRPWGSARLSLKGARVVLTRFYGLSLLIDCEGRKRWLPLPRRTASYKGEALLCMKALIESGADWQGRAWRKLQDGRLVKPLDMDDLLGFEFLIAVIVSPGLMTVPEYLPSTVLINWLIFALGLFVGIISILALPFYQARAKLPRSGFVREGEEVILLKEGVEKWRAPISSLRMETIYLWKPEMMRVRVWSGSLELSLPGREGRESLHPCEAVLVLAELGVPWATGEEQEWWEWSRA